MFMLSLHILILIIEIVQFLLQFSITLFPLMKIKLVRAFTFANFLAPWNYLCYSPKIQLVSCELLFQRVSSA